MVIPESLAVEVDDADIAPGTRYSSFNCPIALAIRRMPGVTSARVTHRHAAVKFTDAATVQYLLPASARRFINYFDNGLPVRPFAFAARLESGEQA